MKINNCPFCGSKARTSIKNYEFIGVNELGMRKCKYRVQVICNKCYSRGKPIVTPGMVREQNKKDKEVFGKYIDEAIEAWNERFESEDKNNGWFS